MSNLIRHYKLTLILILSLLIIILALISLSLRKKEKTIPAQPILTTPTTRPTPSSENEINPPLLEKDSILLEKPWLVKLPLKSREYYVEYNYENKTVEAQVYPPTAFYVSREDQINSIEEIIKGELKRIGVDLNKETINWIIR